MYKSILLPIDGSELSLRAARHGIALARALGATVTALVVTTPWAILFAREVAVVVPDVVVPEREYDLKTETAARNSLSIIVEAAKCAGVPCHAIHERHADPYAAIIDTAASQACDLVVMGSHGRRGLTNLLLGSETTKVVTHCKIPVLVDRPAGPPA